ncbi:hypothetical protein HAALTHF_33410n [Vreelandella aquamarina]|nr:hypothetical protein HAALTHF_33410n [Halomonas axialensis]
MEIDRPEASAATPRPDAQVLIAVTPEGAVWVDGQPVDLHRVGQQVAGMLSGEGSVVIQADRESTTGVLIEVMDRLQQAGGRAGRRGSEPERAMMRHALSMLGGIALAVGLFWMLALLVAPPEQQVDEPIMTMSMTMVEAPEVAPEQEAPPPAPAQAAPAPPPMPTPAPAPVATSTIALPEVELPDAPVEPVELESELPELTEAQPKPTPRPQPAPEPAPEPSPEPAETVAPPAEPAAAQRDAAPAAEPALQ